MADGQKISPTPLPVSTDGPVWANKWEQLLHEKGFLTVNQLAQYLKEYHPTKAVTFPTILRYIEKGHLSCSRVGGQWRVEAKSIKDYILHGTGEGAPSGPSSSTSQSEVPEIPIVKDRNYQSDSDDPEDVAERAEDAKKIAREQKLGINDQGDPNAKANKAR